MSNDYFHKWIVENFVPCCIVYSTDKAKEVFNKNNLTPGLFLRPFGDFKNINIKYDKLGSFNIINNFKLDFYDALGYSRIQKEIIDSFIYNSLVNFKDIPSWNINEGCDNKEDMVKRIHNLQFTSFPWFLEFEKTFLDCLQFNETDLYQQPLISIVFLTSKDEIQSIEKVKLKQNPKLITEGVYQDNLTNLAIILNDKSGEDFLTKEEKELLMSGLKEKYQNYYLFYFDINTGSPNDVLPDIWENYIYKTELYSQDKRMIIRGALISQAERDLFLLNFTKLFEEHISKDLLMIMDSLDANVSDKKKGLSGFLSMFKPNDKRETIKYYNIYSLNQIEKSLYILSMLQFYFQDYKNAYANLKALFSEIKNKKSPQHECSIKQFLTICHFLKTSKKKKIKFSEPYNEYLNNKNYHSALRALFIQIRMLEELLLYDELKKIIKKGMNDLGRYFQLLVPLFYEKESIYYLKQAIPKYRTYNWYMIKAGDNYIKLTKFLEKYALFDYGRFYQFLLKDDKYSFTQMKMFLSKTMGNLCKEVNYFEGGIDFYQKCIELTRYSKNKSANDTSIYLKGLLDLISRKKIKNALKNLSIPEIDNSSVIISENQDYQILESLSSIQGIEKPDYTIFKKYAKNYKNLRWSVLSEDDFQILKFLNMIINKNQISNFYLKRNYVGNVNDIVYVYFTIKNPLNITLSLTSIKLLIEVTEDTNKKGDVFTSDEVSEIIEPKGVRLIKLKLKFNNKGKIIIKGVSLFISEIAQVVHLFNFKKNISLYNYRVKKKGNETHRHVHTMSFSSSSKVRKQKDDFSFEILDDETNIVVTFPEGKNISLYQYQYYTFPIKIRNNSKFNINKYTLYVSDNNSQNLQNFNVLTNYIYETETFKEEQIIYVPILPTKLGISLVKILIKFEENSIYKPIEVKRFLIQITTIPSVVINVSQTITDYNIFENFLTNQIFSTASIKSPTIQNLIFGKKIYNNKKYQEITLGNWMSIYSDQGNKFYANFNLKGIISAVSTNEKEIKEKITEIIKQKDIKQNNYNKIIDCFYDKIKEDYLLLPFSFHDIEKGFIECIYLIKILSDSIVINESLIEKLLINNVVIQPSIEKINEIFTLVNLQVSIPNKNKVKHLIDQIIIKSNQEDNDFEWVGLSEKRFTLIEDKPINEEFSFLTNHKGKFDVNKLTFIVISNNLTFQFINIPNSIIIEV